MNNQEIKDICTKYNINDYTINPDGSIDVNGDVDLFNKGLTKLPLKFNKVTGFFDCSYNNLTNLEGSPNYVGGNFYCINNNLTTLEGSPNHIGGFFTCDDNNLTSLEGYKLPYDKLYCNNKDKLIRKHKLNIIFNS